MSNHQNLGTFLEMATKSLVKYPESVIDLMANPTSGIVTKNTFMPSIAEMVKFCDLEMDRRWKKSQHDAGLRGDELPPPEYDDEHRKNMRGKILAEFKKLGEELAANDKRGKIPFEERYGYAPERDYRVGKLGWQLKQEQRA
jgi:hypothetical protein